MKGAVHIPGLGYYIDERVDWDDADEGCTSRGMSLTSLHDVDQYWTMVEYMKANDINSDIWLNGKEMHGSWKWPSGNLFNIYNRPF